MTTEAITERPELTKLRRQDVAIAELAKQYMPLTIAGIDDREGYEAVHKARMVCVKTRTGIEATRKILVADALEYQRTVNAEAKRIAGMLEPIESHLTEQQKAVDDAKAEIARREEEARAAVLRGRMEFLAACGVTADPVTVAKWNALQWEAAQEAAKKEHAERERVRLEQEAEAARLAKEAAEARAREDAERRAEAERLKAERERLEAIAAEQRAAQERIDAANREIEANRQAEQRAAEMEKQKKLAAERAIEAERLRVEEETRLRIAKEQAEEAARIKAEAEKPYREKLIAFAAMIDSLAANIPAGPCGPKVVRIVSRAANAVRELAAGEIEGEVQS